MGAGGVHDLRTALQVSRLCKSFGGVQAVRDVSFSVQEHEIVGLIGPNGSGKTTVLNLIAGFHRPDAGDAVFFGNELIGLRPSQIAQLGLIRTWQDPRVVEHLTVGQNVSLGRLARDGWANSSGADRDGWLDRLLHLFALTDCADAPAGILPYGRQKILALARTFAAGPKLLLLDEPMAGLSQTEIKFVLDQVRAFKQHGAVLIVDHAFSSLSEVCDRLVVLNSGAKLFEGVPEEVAKDPAVMEVYFGEH
jgi:branched-chain amino acid transport system ATP-binding protein